MKYGKECFKCKDQLDENLSLDLFVYEHNYKPLTNSTYEVFTRELGVIRYSLCREHIKEVANRERKIYKRKIVFYIVLSIILLILFFIFLFTGVRNGTIALIPAFFLLFTLGLTIELSFKASIFNKFDTNKPRQLNFLAKNLLWNSFINETKSTKYIKKDTPYGGAIVSESVVNKLILLKNNGSIKTYPEENALFLLQKPDSQYRVEPIFGTYNVKTGKGSELNSNLQIFITNNNIVKRYFLLKLYLDNAGIIVKN
jgi:hypothetical protein